MKCKQCGRYLKYTNNIYAKEHELFYECECERYVYSVSDACENITISSYYKPELNFSDLTLVKVCVGIVQEQGVLIPELQARLPIILEALKRAEIEYKENNNEDKS